METNLNNLRKPMFWLELPYEIAKGVGTEILRMVDVRPAVERRVDRAVDGFKLDELLAEYQGHYDQDGSLGPKVTGGRHSAI